MINVALACCLPIFHHLTPFLENKNGEVQENFRAQLESDFSVFEHEAASKGLGRLKIDHIKYALAALADEMILHSSWSEKLSWMRRSLQLQFFGEHNAGEGFFARLSQLRQAGIAEVDLLEIYALCLQLGFRGIYRFKESIQWTNLMSSLAHQITLLRGESRLFLLSPTDKQNNFPVNKKYRTISVGWVVCVTAALIFFIYAGYGVAMRFQLHEAVNTLTSEMAYDD